ncbi:hypothetical protein B0H14DRAFT_3513254 [Mycena olivaceomarginata]|nr:hypothetical protein B0H14DRAFT_3513254 [Mycena olivaceomarginata]
MASPCLLSVQVTQTPHANSLHLPSNGPVGTGTGDDEEITRLLAALDVDSSPSPTVDDEQLARYLATSDIPTSPPPHSVASAYFCRFSTTLLSIPCLSLPHRSPARTHEPDHVLLPITHHPRLDYTLVGRGLCHSRCLRSTSRRERSWIRNVTDATTRPISALPQPITAEPTLNSLNRSEGEDDRWYVVYRGICPSVYRSHLECQLNTLGVSKSMHECIQGRDTALAKYAATVSRAHTGFVSPPYSVNDPFL